jgi:hypothetical protein
MQPINRFCGPPAHATKWTLVVDRPREARTLLLCDTQAEVHVEIIRLRERGVAHVFALAPVVACSDRPAVAAAALERPRVVRTRPVWSQMYVGFPGRPPPPQVRISVARFGLLGG